MTDPEDDTLTARIMSVNNKLSEKGFYVYSLHGDTKIQIYVL